MNSSNNIALECRNITKTFGSVVANKNVNLSVKKGEILSILGENGSGKTTLMNMISGIYFPDEGSILVDGKEVTIRSPKDAFDLKIGMIHQHFKLVDVFSGTENIVLGMRNKKFNIKKAHQEIKETCDKYGFEIDLNKKIYDLSVSEKQTIEIVKVIYKAMYISINIIISRNSNLMTINVKSFTIRIGKLRTFLCNFSPSIFKNQF